jgi:DNA-binding XRE family transcriptional regulator
MLREMSGYSTLAFMAAKNQTVRILRKLCGLTQAELAQVIGCARLTVHGLEAGKLKLSDKMADKIALHTAVSPAWLLANNPKTQPVCQHDRGRPYTREVFQMRRAEVLDSRTAPMDLIIISKNLESFCAQFRAVALAAYRAEEIIYFNYTIREFLEHVEQRWKISGQSGLSEDKFWQSLENDSVAKKTRKRHQ